MGTLGPSGGATFADDATVGTVAWANASNARYVDQVYATATLIVTQISHYLKATGFGFAIPSDATILGITVEVLKSSTVLSLLTDSSVKLVRSGVISGTDLADAVTGWPTSDAYVTYGGPTNLWGQTWTPAIINGSDFGVAVAVTSSGTAIGNVDYIRITVDYLGSNRCSMWRHAFGWGS